MFDMQYEVELLQTRLNSMLALECLDIEKLQEASIDLGYIRCIIDYKIAIDRELFEKLVTSVEAYEREVTL